MGSGGRKISVSSIKKKKKAEPVGKTPIYEINAWIFLVMKNYR